MSDKNKSVECRIHGTSYATFVCQHLQKAKGLVSFVPMLPMIPTRTHGVLRNTRIWQFSAKRLIDMSKYGDIIECGGT